eukprot:COSAG02_NODE_221_length_28385_cov_5.795164_18_plen_122_part_00
MTTATLWPRALRRAVRLGGMASSSSACSGSSGSDGSEIADFLEDFGSSSDDGDLSALHATQPPVPQPEPEPEPEPCDVDAPSAESGAVRWEAEPAYAGPISSIDWPLLQRLYRCGTRASVS